MANSLYDLEALKKYVREGSIARGIDPDTAIKVWTGEGMAPGVWQSNIRKNGVREPSYGPFQFLVGGKGTGFKEGMGNDFIRDTGLDPRDPKNVKAMADYAMDNAAKGGWSPWYGARDQGIGRMEGIGPNAKVMPASYSPPVEASAGPNRGLSQPEPAMAAAGPAEPASLSSNPIMDRAALLQMYTRQGGTGGLGAGPGARARTLGMTPGPKNIQQAIQMKKLETGVINPVVAKAQEWYDKWTGAKPQTPQTASSPVNPTVIPAGGSSEGSGLAGLLRKK